jgi:hypothetical protein
VSALSVSFAIFAMVLGGAVLGALLRSVLPAHHMSDESKAAIQLSIGLVATLSALVLGLLLASAKTSFDTKSEEINLSATKVILLDRTLRRFGPETAPSRELMKQVLLAKVNLSWLENGGERAAAAPVGYGIEELQHKINMLTPTTDIQRALQLRAITLAADLAQTRWLLLEQSGSSIPLPFLGVLVFWLAVIFGSIGLFSPRTATAYAVVFVCALSVTAAMFLILELDRPFDGVLSISDAPLRSVIAQINR